MSYSADGRGKLGGQWMTSGEEDAALPHVIQNTLAEWERTIKWRVIYTS